MATSCCQTPLQGVIAQSIARKLAARGSRQFASGSRRSIRSSSSTSSKANTFALLSESPRATSVLDKSTPAPPTPDVPTLVLTPLGPPTTPAAMLTNDLFWQFMQAYMEDRRNPVPALAFLPTKPQEEASDQLLKAQNPDLYYSNLHIEC